MELLQSSKIKKETFGFEFTAQVQDGSDFNLTVWPIPTCIKNRYVNEGLRRYSTRTNVGKVFYVSNDT